MVEDSDFIIITSLMDTDYTDWLGTSVISSLVHDNNVSMYIGSAGALFGIYSEVPYDIVAPRITLGINPEDNNWSNDNTPSFTFTVADDISTGLMCILFINGTGEITGISLAFTYEATMERLCE